MTIEKHATVGSVKPRRAASSPASRKKAPGKEPQRRDALATKARILEASREEFARHGYGGGRIERIAKRAKVNIRMLYHYYGGKEKLYLAALEDTYHRVREREGQLALKDLEPEVGLRKLIEFTFDYMIEDRFFVRLIANENLLEGKFLKNSSNVPAQTLPLVDALEAILRRGQRARTFRKKVSAVQLYVTILSLCFIHIANRYTLSIMFRQDLADAGWLAERRGHVVEVVFSYLKAEA